MVVSDVVRGGGGDEGGELEAEALHVQPPVLLHVLALHLAAAAAGVPVHGGAGNPAAAAGLPPALHLSDSAFTGRREWMEGRETHAGWLV